MAHTDQAPRASIVFTEIRPGMKLRAMIVRNPDPKGVVLFLHGFPETLHSWTDAALALGKDYEVHAFDWPGYGLSSRPAADSFSYAPKDYAGILQDYILKAGIDTSRLVIYATDIGSLPALLLALDDPHVARSIVVGDFAPLNRPEYMYESLQALKSLPAAEGVRAFMNKTRDEILANVHRRGLSEGEQFELPKELQEDMANGWSQGGMTSVDALYNYYLHFTRDQEYLESHIQGLKTPVKVIWGEKDIYINHRMGAEFARKAGAELAVLPGVGHFPHLQNPARTVEDVRAEFDR
jgi:pimeloyl-ACP methyl ester carboxylesterase